MIDLSVECELRQINSRLRQDCSPLARITIRIAADDAATFSHIAARAPFSTGHHGIISSRIGMLFRGSRPGGRLARQKEIARQIVVCIRYVVAGRGDGCGGTRDDV